VESIARSLACALMLTAATSMATESRVRDAADPAEAINWAHPAPRDRLHDCTSLDRSLTVAVPEAQREDAIRRLEKTAIVELDPTDARAVVELYLGPKLSATDLIKRAIAGLDDTRREALVQRRGSWTVKEQQRLDRLTKSLSDPGTSKLRPFLVRALVRNEATGMFFVQICGNELDVEHGALGAAGLPSRQVPLVVFLQDKPATVYVAP
jgi:hypothetical protein